jgi:DNA invertase Pin-like site-specific DNA recombinase
VAHNDGNPRNNHISNLRWATAKENLADRHIHGTAPIGEKNYKAKLSGMTDEKIRNIRQMLSNNVRQAEIARRFGIAQCTVSEIKHRRIWAHVE